MEPNLELEKKLNKWAWAISAVVIALAGTVHPLHIEIGFDTSFLPSFHSGLNVIAAIALIAALYFVKNKNIKAHQQSIYIAMVCSILFLLSYVVYHITNGETLFLGQGVIRTVYFFFLITHIILAAVILPFILFTFIRAYTNQIERHKKMARWVYPIWLYVAITGPICYLMLRPYY